MPVNLPIGASQSVATCLCPFADRGVRLPQAGVGPQVGDDCNAPAGRIGPHDTILLGKRLCHLNADFQANSTIPINRHVPPTPDTLSLQGLPDATTALGHHTREFGRRDLTSQDSERSRWDIVDLNNE